MHLHLLILISLFWLGLCPLRLESSMGARPCHAASSGKKNPRRFTNQGAREWNSPPFSFFFLNFGGEICILLFYWFTAAGLLPFFLIALFLILFLNLYFSGSSRSHVSPPFASNPCSERCTMICLHVLFNRIDISLHVMQCLCNASQCLCAANHPGRICGPESCCRLWFSCKLDRGVCLLFWVRVKERIYLYCPLALI